jgi:hypothetical protein
MVVQNISSVVETSPLRDSTWALLFLQTDHSHLGEKFEQQLPCWRTLFGEDLNQCWTPGSLFIQKRPTQQIITGWTSGNHLSSGCAVSYANVHLDTDVKHTSNVASPSNLRPGWSDANLSRHQTCRDDEKRGRREQPIRNDACDVAGRYIPWFTVTSHYAIIHVC